MAEVKERIRIGDLLVDKGIISVDQLRIALIEQRKQNLPIGKILVRLGFVTEHTMRETLGELLGHESVDLSKVLPDSEAINLVPKEVARRYKLIPLTVDFDKKILTVAMSDTFNVVALDQTAVLLGGDLELKPVLASEADVEASIDHFYGYELSVSGILNELETGEIDYQSMEANTNEYSHPLVRLVDALLADAVKKGASDIHFEPEESFLRVRYRIDGVLRQVQAIHKNYLSGIVVRLKVLAGMDIAETRAPQDGRISLTIASRLVDFRVATHPTSHGENIVLRVLDRDKGIVALDKLGLTSEALMLLRLMMARPEGIIIVTGPTGSGKTTTLYSLLNDINEESRNIMTLEDPVEYPMALIRQSSISESAKLDFANGIRSLMRQDPDVILVGEVRDEATATMAFRAAMTGHQVYTTLHTNSALGAIPRLLDIGMHRGIMSGNIIGIVAQRLVRRLCDQCKEEYVADDFERKLLGHHQPVVKIYKAAGCAYCDQHGYRGRIGLIEILRFDRELDELIAQGATMSQLYDKVIENGFIPLAEDGIRRVLEGLTSLDEITRVLDLTNRIT